MATLIEKLIEDAKDAPKRVALPECEADNTLLAARQVLDEGIGTPVLVSPLDVINETAARAGVSIDGMEVVDNTDEAAADTLAERYMAGGERLISAKGARRKIKNPMYYAMMMEELGDVDCTFCGHTNTTGDVLMAAQTIIGLQEGVDVPSILALVETPGFEGPEGNVMCFSDCGLNARCRCRWLEAHRWRRIRSCSGAFVLRGAIVADRREEFPASSRQGLR